MRGSVSDDQTQYHIALIQLKKTRDALQPGNALLMSINSVIINAEMMKKNETVSLIELTTGLQGINLVMAEINGKNTEKLLEALAQLEAFKSSLANARLKRHLQYFLTAVAVLIVSAIIILAAIHFPPVLLFPTLSFALKTTAIPGIAGVIPAFTAGNIVMNLLVGAGIGIIRPPAWKYSRDTYRAWHYHRAVKALETTITKKMNEGEIEANLASHAKIFLDEIQNIKKMGNQSKGVDKLTRGLEAVNNVLNDPMNIKKLEILTNIAEHYSAEKTTLTKAYELFLASLAPLATIAIVVAFPVALIQSAGYLAHSLAVQFLGFVVPYSGMGLGPDSALGFMFINNSLSAAGEAAVEIPKKSSNMIEHLKSWMGYQTLEPALLEPPALDKAIKTIKKGLKSRRVKGDMMREKMLEFKEQFNDVARETDKPTIPSRHK